MMKFLKGSKAYGAFEYTIIIALVIVVALVILNLVKGKASGGGSTLDSATTAADAVITDWVTDVTPTP